MGGKIQTEHNDGGGPPQFGVNGQNYHGIGNLLHIPGETPSLSTLCL